MKALIKETERLQLRPFIEADRADFYRLIRDKMSSREAVYDDQYPTDDDGLGAVFGYFIGEGRNEFFAVKEKSGGVIGFIALNIVDDKTRNLGFCVLSGKQNRGYATEAVNAVIEFAKSQLKIAKLVSGTAENNVAAVKLFERAGFTETGRSEASFACDNDGRPIVFTACGYELDLKE